MWYVYIIKCSDRSLYAGITNDIAKRLAAHNSGKAAKYTRARLPVKLVYKESHPNRAKASKREYEIKRFSREQKQALVRSFVLK